MIATDSMHKSDLMLGSTCDTPEPPPETEAAPIPVRDPVGEPAALSPSADPGPVFSDVLEDLGCATAEYAAAMQGWSNAPLDPQAQRHLNDAIKRGRYVWAIYQKEVLAGRAAKTEAAVPKAFQERWIYREASQD